MKEKNSITANYDNSWKDILDDFLEEFMKLFFPAAYDDIDWGKGYKSLEKELSQIASEAAVGRRVVDKLLSVYRKNGEEKWVYIHVEVQSQRDSDVAERMYIYNSLLYLRFKKPVMSLLVLGDNQLSWRPERFEYDLWGSQIQLKFQMVKLLDYRNRLKELKKSENPFVYFVIAHLKTLETNSKPQLRLDHKDTITKEMMDQSFPLKVIASLIRFIDIMMTLPPDLEEMFMNKVYKYQEEKNMPVLAPFEEIAERRGEKRGEKRGEHKGSIKEAQATVIDNLSVKFGEIPPTLTKSINKMEDISVLRELRKRAIIVDSLKEFEEIMKKGKA